jgi:hypothetical protein
LGPGQGQAHRGRSVYWALALVASNAAASTGIRPGNTLQTGIAKSSGTVIRVKHGLSDIRTCANRNGRKLNEVFTYED